MGIIYCYTNLQNGKQYIGQTINPEQRKKQHYSSAFNPNDKDYDAVIHRAFRKYGYENFEYKILAESIEDINILNLLENYYIQTLNTKIPFGYNVIDGGANASTPKSDETKDQLMRAKMELSEEEIIQIREAYARKESPKAYYDKHYKGQMHYNSFLNICQSRNVKQNTIKAYKTFINAHIIPYFKEFMLKNITISNVESFRKCMQNKQISKRRIKNILTLLNQIIKHFQNEGYIDKTCVFEVKRIANIPKRQIQILTPEQLAQLFKILKKKYPYMLPIVQKLIALKQPLNTILTGSEQEKNKLKNKIRKDFYKVKKEMGLANYMFDDLRFCNHIDN